MGTSAALRAAIYLRNSDPKQAAAGTHHAQLAEARATAARLGADLVGIYTDTGKSAKTGTLRHRGDYARLLAEARAGCFDLVIVVNIDRLSRTVALREMADTLSPLQDAGVKVATTSGQIIDLQTPD